jgi:hypothetical protein
MLDKADKELVFGIVTGFGGRCRCSSCR